MEISRELLKASGFSVTDAPRHDDLRPHSVDLKNGRMSHAVDESVAVLRAHPDVFDLGGVIVRIHDGAMVPLDRHALAHFLGGQIKYTKFTSSGPCLADPPQRLVDQIMSLGALRGLRPLDAVTTIPTLRPDGSVLDVPGYDQESRLLYVAAGNVPQVPSHPTVDQVRAAYDMLLYPFRLFPFVAPVDWTVKVAALISAVVRPALPTCPAFGFDAPDVGAGKTLLAKCDAMLASGETPEPWPPITSREDEETRKRLFAALRTGTRIIFWDNLTGTLDSPATAAFLTAPNFRDRVLGKSESLALPNRALLLMSGNNMVFAGDMPRRVLTCRIDPRCEQAFARQFDLDPLDYVRRNRTAMATAALTIVRGWLTSGAPRANGRTASFEAWDDFVRQPVTWLMGVDPLDAIRTTATADPERESLADLLSALRACFGDNAFTAGDVADAVRRGSGPLASPDQRVLAAAIADIAGRDQPSTKSIGRILNYRRDRIANGMRLASRQARNVKEWFVGLMSV